ncbi:MAG: sigma-54-dependent Fis family transcriptional regulator, partial [Proteobacteria bacterium]|nr:sigma-54-dependent Fis family transcriptional regulator [Pseudomonadota bacterium]
MSHILVVEDEPIILESLTRLLERQGYLVTGVGSVIEAEENASTKFDLIISDLRLPGEPGTTLIRKAAPAPVLIMTSYSTVQSAVDAMKDGAVDYIAKPFNHDEMIMTVKRILDKAMIEQQNTILQKEVARDYPMDGMIGDCEPMLELLDRIGRVAPTDATVLIVGGMGTGKELVARSIHAQSSRKDQTLISVNCAAFAENLIEAELFGQEKGAFTGALQVKKGLIEAANGGTLFLDEIGELPLDAQSSLLRVLQEGEIRGVGSSKLIKVDVRFLIATHKNLQQMVEDRRFREDLYDRLSLFELQVPALRDRDGDIKKLAQAILTKMSNRIHRKSMTFSAQAYEELVNYSWPGNVRELENVIERAVLLSKDKYIGPDDLPEAIRSNKGPLQESYEPMSLKEALAKPER